MQLCVLGNLCPETVEEAIAMVPSIKVCLTPSTFCMGFVIMLMGYIMLGIQVHSYVSER